MKDEGADRAAKRRIDEGSFTSMRRIRVDGVSWIVYLRDDSYDRRARPHLVFETDGVVRRVRDYPENWAELSDAALFEVSHHR